MNESGRVWQKLHNFCLDVRFVWLVEVLLWSSLSSCHQLSHRAGAVLGCAGPGWKQQSTTCQENRIRRITPSIIISQNTVHTAPCSYQVKDRRTQDQSEDIAVHSMGKLRLSNPLQCNAVKALQSFIVFVGGLVDWWPGVRTRCVTWCDNNINQISVRESTIMSLCLLSDLGWELLAPCCCIRYQKSTVSTLLGWSGSKQRLNMLTV